MKEFLSSKLTPPDSAIKPLARTRLNVADSFIRAHCGLLALTAPAGYGKSTLMMQWWQQLEEQKIKCLWLGLDHQDADPKRFEQALIGALTSSEAESSTHSLEHTLLQLEQQAGRRVLFIDDLHFIHAQEAEHVLRWLIAHMPSNLQLILAGRSLPESAGLSRLVLEGKALRFGSKELALTQSELAKLLDVPADEPWLQPLWQQTEGWPLAARIISISREENGSVQPPKGRDRDLSAYLTDALLNGLPADIQPLVFAASLLPRFCAEQLDQVLEQSHSQQQLRWLETHNVFLIPLDRECRWYRFHHLVSDFLASRLSETNPQQLQTWRKRAATWCDQNHYFEDSIELALAACDYENAANRFEAVATQLAQFDGRHESILRWCQQLPEATLKPRYRLRLNYILARTFVGDFDWARTAVTQLIMDMQGQVSSEEENEFRAAAEVFACIVAALEDEAELTEELSSKWLERWPNSSPLFMGVACSTRAYAAKCHSAFDEALAWSQRAKQLFVRVDSVYAEAWATALQAVSLIRMGALTQAQTVLQPSLQTALRRLGKNTAAAGTLSALLASAHLERCEYEKTADLLNFEFDSLGSQTSTDVQIAAWLTAARLKALQGQHKAAQAILLDGEAVGQERDLPRLVLTLATERAINHLRAGRSELARHIMASEFAAYENRETLAPLIRDKQLQLSVRLALTEKSDDSLQELIYSQLQRAQQKEQPLKAIQWAIFAVAAGDTNAIATALSLAEETGAIRPLVADASLIRAALLQHFAQAKPSSRISERLKALMGLDGDAGFEALTSKETEILLAMAEGLSNKELARRLFVSEGTVKWHLHNIYNKLDAKNRNAALAKARSAGLLG